MHGVRRKAWGFGIGSSIPLGAVRLCFAKSVLDLEQGELVGDLGCAVGAYAPRRRVSAAGRRLWVPGFQPS